MVLKAFTQLQANLSHISLTLDSPEICPQLATLKGSPFLQIGTTSEVFKTSGRRPAWKERFVKLARGVHISCTSTLRILVGMLRATSFTGAYHRDYTKNFILNGWEMSKNSLLKGAR